jgi:hypothetical protein
VRSEGPIRPATPSVQSSAPAIASSRLQLPLLLSDRRSVLPVGGKALSTFSVKMEKAGPFASCLLLPDVEDFQFVSDPDVLTTHRPLI